MIKKFIGKIIFTVTCSLDEIFFMISLDFGTTGQSFDQLNAFIAPRSIVNHISQNDVTFHLPGFFEGNFQGWKITVYIRKKGKFQEENLLYNFGC